MLSPIDNNSTITLIKKIPTYYIIDLYKSTLGIDVSSYFKEVPDVSVFECVSTEYRFFYPFTISGDRIFYEKLQKLDGYYIPDKWEFNTALKFIKPSDSVLDVGCGNGHFLNLLKQNGNKDILGIDTSIQETNLIKNTTLKELSQKGVKKDVICAFQLLEHLWDVKTFFDECIRLLNPNGKLIISVPNNEGYLKYAEDPLNLPPHHMGLWTLKAFKNLTQIFPIELIYHQFEPLQDYQKQFFFESYANFFYKKNRILGAAIYRSKFFILPIISVLKNKLKGHSLLVVFQKKSQ